MNRLTIISVAVSDYNHLKKLNGPTSDIQKLKFLLEPISKMPKKDHSTSESNKPIEIKIVIFI
ncbi:hypothetical protein, partial [Leptospira weilii]